MGEGEEKSATKYPGLPKREKKNSELTHGMNREGEIWKQGLLQFF